MSHIKLRLVSLWLANDVMHLHVIISPFPVRMRLCDCSFSSDEVSACETCCHLFQRHSAADILSSLIWIFHHFHLRVQIKWGCKSITANYFKYCLNLCLGTGNISSPPTYRRADYLLFCIVCRCFCRPTGEIIVLADPSYFTDM